MGGDPSATILARHGRSFHWAARFLPKDQARNAARLYAFCRAVDDLADRDGGPGAEDRLRRLRALLIVEHPSDPLARAFSVLNRDIDLTLPAARQLIDGVCSDLSSVRMADEAELLRYAYRVGGTVGILMCDVLGVREAAARRHAVDLGIAMQLTNIARDVLEDAENGRRYLPARWVLAAPGEIARGDRALEPAIRAAVLRLISLSERYYASGAAGYRFLPRRARLAIAVAAALYKGIGTSIARRGGDYSSGRTVVPVWRKVALTLGTAVLPPAVAHASHDPDLHRHFADLAALAFQPQTAREDIDDVAA